MPDLERLRLHVPRATAAGTLEVTAPWDNAPIAAVEQADRRGIETALETAYGLYRDRDQWMSPATRIAILDRAIEILTSRRDALALEAAREGGKPLVDSRVEADRAIDSVRICVEALRTQGGREIPMNINAASADRLALTTYEPRGVVVAFSAFNHPLNLIAHQVAPAIATGCPVIVKPAEATPISCWRFVEILHEAGLAESWCQALLTTDLDVAGALAGDPRVGFFSFIGSAKVGWMLRSKLAPGARCALEHGGAAPVVVAADADLDDALPLLAKGGLYHAGQVCVSVQRVFAERAIVDDVAARLATLAAAQTVGDPTVAETDVGPLIREAEVTRVGAWVDQAVDGGARKLTGGAPLSATTYAPTILVDPPADAKISREEIFGPVIAVYPYDDIDAAIDRANALPYAFQAAIFTRDLDTAFRGARRLDAATVLINDQTAFRVDWMPFAGARESGLGTGGVPYTMDDMQLEKLTVFRSKELGYSGR